MPDKIRFLTVKMLKVNFGNFIFKYHPNQLYMLGNGDSDVYHGRIKMRLNPLNGRKRCGRSVSVEAVTSAP